MADRLDALFNYLDSLESRPSLNELAGRLEQLKPEAQDLADYLRFGEPTYQRILVRAGRWYHLWVLCWKNGQRSPIHDHMGSNCAVRVLRGTPSLELAGRLEGPRYSAHLFAAAFTHGHLLADRPDARRRNLAGIAKDGNDLAGEQ
jgi:hypothetical protein